MSVLAVLAAWSPVDPSDDQARSEVQHELSRGRYLEADSVLDRLGRWLADLWERLFGAALGGGFPTVFLVLVVILVVVGLCWLLPRVRRERRGARRSGAVVLDEPALDASGYRDRAARAFAEGRTDDALLDAFRAIASDAVRRTLVPDTPGLTAHEIAVALATPFPDRTRELRTAAGWFDAVCYGDTRASRDWAAAVLSLDRELAATRPVHGAAVEPAP